VGGPGCLQQSLIRELNQNKNGAGMTRNFTRPVERFNAIADGKNYRLTVVLVEADDRVALFDLCFLAKVGRMFGSRPVNVRQRQNVEIPNGQNLPVELNGMQKPGGEVRSCDVTIQCGRAAIECHLYGWRGRKTADAAGATRGRSRMEALSLRFRSLRHGN